MNKTMIRYCLTAFLALSANITLAGRMEPPANVKLVDLTDDVTQMKERFASKGLITGSSQQTAFDIVGDVPSAIKKMSDLQKGNTRFGGVEPLWIAYGFTTPQVVNAYRIYNQVDLDAGGADCKAQSPRDFYLEGSQTGTEDSWVVLDEVKNEPEWNPLESRYFECDNAIAYSYYRIRFISSHGDPNIVVQEMELFSVPRNTLTVVGSPGNCGNVTPAYGTYRMEVGDTIDLTAPEQISLDGGIQVATCLGWKVSRATAIESAPWELLAEGVGSSGTFTHPGGCCRWEWKYAIASQVEGNIVYVGLHGSDVNSGRLVVEPKWTIANAIKELENDSTAAGSKIVYVLSGRYKIMEEIKLTNAVAVIGLTGKPDDVIVQNTTNATNKSKTQRVFVLDNPNAMVLGLTMEKGDSLGNGGNAAILSGGGTISNCVMRSGMVRKANGRGAGIYLDSDAALVTHCRIEGSFIGKSSTSATDGLGAYVARGRISNSLFVGNATEGIEQGVGATNCHVIRLLDGLLDNCTIVDNFHTGLVAAVRADAPAKVVNCVMAKTRSTEDTFVRSWAGDAAAFVNCATDDAKPINETCITGSVYNMFADYKNGNYCPKGGGILQDSGTTDGIEIPSTDLVGEKRVRGKAIDIGCYESAPRNFLIRIR